MAIPYYRMPDGGIRPVRIPKPKTPVLRKPRGVYTKGPVTSQGVRLSTPKKASSSIRLATPRISIPTTTSANIPGSGGGGGISLPGMGSTIASLYHRSDAQLRQMAKEAVMLEAQPQINALNLTGQQEHKNYDYLITQLRKQLGLSKSDLNTMYGMLDVTLAANARDQSKINTDTKTKVGQIYDTLSSQIGTTYNQAQGNVQNELSRLGIQAPAADDRIVADKALLTANAQTSKANSQGLIDAINVSTQGMMGGLRSNAAATGAMLQTGLQQQFDKESADALQKHLAKLSEIRMQQSTLKASLPGKINQTYSALLDQQYQREMDAAQKLFDNQIKLGNYQISQQNAASSAAYRQNQLALSAQKLALDAQKKAAPKPLKGVDKSLDYLRRVSSSSHIPFADLQNILIDAINGDPNRPVDMPGYNKNYMSGYASDINNAVKSRGYPQLYTDLVRAMNYWFGG